MDRWSLGTEGNLDSLVSVGCEGNQGSEGSLENEVSLRINVFIGS